MSDGKMLLLRNAWVEECAKILPETTCRAYAGRFNLAELEAVMIETPAVLVACLGSKNIKEVADEQVDVSVAMVAFIVVADMDDMERDRAGLNITEAVILRLMGNGELLDGARDVLASDIDGIENLYSGALREQGVGIWAVSWGQMLRLGASIFDEDGVVPSDAYVSRSPKIGQKHEDDYQKLEGGNAGV